MRVIIRLNEAQVAHIAEVLGNLSLVLLASLILPAFIGQPVEKEIIQSGLVLTITSFAMSVQILKGGV